MAIFQCKVKSQKLCNNTDVTVFIPYLPPGPVKEGGPYPYRSHRYQVLYLLHGHSGDNQDWVTHTNIINYAQERQLAVIMPSAWDSFYCDMAYGKAFWAYISEELPYFIESMFPVSTRREDTFVAGLSMGGYGAMKLGLHHPERFCAAASLSGVLDLSRGEDLEGIADTMRNVFGTGPVKEDDLMYVLERGVRSGVKLPDLYVACGTADFLYQQNQNFLNKAKSLNVPVKYEEEAEAGHEWSFWDTYIRRVLDWLPLIHGPV